MNAPTAQPTITVGGFSIDILVQGYPGKTVCHGGLGWSTVALVRGEGRVILIDSGNFGMRRLISERLSAHGLSPSEVTDVILTHSHYDHSLNWPMFSSSRVLIGKQELDWALAQPIGHHIVPEFYVRELAKSPQLHGVEIAEEVLPGITAYAGPGHTPGHLVYVLNGGERDVIFSGDAAKNRAEMLSLTADMTMNERRQPPHHGAHLGFVAQEAGLNFGAGARRADAAGERRAGLHRQAHRRHQGVVRPRHGRDHADRAEGLGARPISRPRSLRRTRAAGTGASRGAVCRAP